MPLIGTLCGELTALSTVKPPNAAGVDFGHSTGMTLSGILARIDQRLAQLALSDNAASKRSGHPDLIRNMRRALINGGVGPAPKTLSDLAAALETTHAWLIGEPETTSSEPEGLRILRTKRVELLRQIYSIDQAIELIEESADLAEAAEPVAARKTKK